MAFRGRGGGGHHHSHHSHHSHHGFHHHHHYHHYHHYGPISLYEIIVVLIVLFIIAMGSVNSYFSIYKTIIDPIKNIKDNFVFSYIGVLAVTIILFIAINVNVEEGKKANKCFMILAFISILLMLVFLGIKDNLDKTYVRDYFISVYDDLHTDDYKKIEVINGKKPYVESCEGLYQYFTVKYYGLFVFHLVLEFIFFYESFNSLKLNKKQDRLAKDDLIVYDEEQNVRF